MKLPHRPELGSVAGLPSALRRYAKEILLDHSGHSGSEDLRPRASPGGGGQLSDRVSALREEFLAYALNESRMFPKP